MPAVRLDRPRSVPAPRPRLGPTAEAPRAGARDVAPARGGVPRVDGPPVPIPLQRLRRERPPRRPPHRPAGHRPAVGQHRRRAHPARARTRTRHRRRPARGAPGARAGRADGAAGPDPPGQDGPSVGAGVPRRQHRRVLALRLRPHRPPAPPRLDGPRALCTAPWAEALATGSRPWPEPVDGAFDVDDMLAGAPPDDFEVAVDRDTAQRLGLEPAYQLLTWVCDVPRRRR